MKLTPLPMAISLVLLASTNLSAQDESQDDPFAESRSTVTVDPFAVADDQRGTDPFGVPPKMKVQTGLDGLQDSRSKRSPVIVNRQAAELRI